MLARLEDLRRRVIARESLLARSLRLLPRAASPLRGLYLWGGVGRGKSFLVESFFTELPLREKRRDHFHRFMLDVHRRLKGHHGRTSPLDRVAGDLAAAARVLCLDEFVVADVADAMILGTLLDALFRRGVTLVATSNLPPAELYRGGLQRDRFLPAVALIERHCRVVQLDSGIDYRLRQLERATPWLGPDVPDPDARLSSGFEELAGGPGKRDARIGIAGRILRARRAAEYVAWFDFRELCDGPRGAADYVELARCYHTVLLGGVPVMDEKADDAARRFITLVDEFYDRGVKLFIAAAADEPERLYTGERLAFEFRRAASRLQEMRGRAYLAKPHRP